MKPFDANNPYNLRGVRISPKGSPNTHFYFILIDMLVGDTNEGFTIAPTQPSREILSYNYAGTFNNAPKDGSRTVTHMLPIFTSQNVIEPSNTNYANLCVEVTDSTGATRTVGTTIKGNPSSLKPPIVEVIDNGTPWSTASLIMSSQTNPANQFAIFLCNNGGNSATLITDIQIVNDTIASTDTTIYQCTLAIENAAVGGVSIGAISIGIPAEGEPLPEYVRTNFPGQTSDPRLAARTGPITPINYNIL